MNTTFLGGFPGKPGRERIALAVAIVAPGFGVVAGILIDWNRQDIFGGVIESPLARGVLFASFAITALCFLLFLCFRHLTGKRSNPSLQRTPDSRSVSKPDASGPAPLS
jgi:hypothetical protein